MVCKVSKLGKERQSKSARPLKWNELKLFRLVATVKSTLTNDADFRLRAKCELTIAF